MFCSAILIPFLDQCKRRGEHPAFVLEDEATSYIRLAEHIAHHFRLLVLVQENYIGIHVDETIHSYAAIWAVWFCGKTAVPISDSNSVDRVDLVKRDCGRFHMYSPIEHGLHQFSDTIDATEFLYSNYVHDNEACNDLMVLYTSGSTGIPKGTPLTRSNLVHFMRAFTAIGYGWQAGDRCMQMFDLSFDFSMLVYLPAWLNGATIYGIPKGVHLTLYVYHLINDKQLTVLPIVPTILNYLRPYFDEIAHSSLRQIMIGGEAVPVSLLNAWFDNVANGDFLVVYGPTECTMLSASFPYSRQNRLPDSESAISLGWLFEGMIGLVVDSDNEIVPVDEVGELCLAGPQLTPGYLGRAELNAEKFFMRAYEGELHRFYKTGDMVIGRSDGRYDFVGRIDNQVKLQGGFRVELNEIEGVICNALMTVRCVATVVKNAMKNNHLVVVFESDEFDVSSLKLVIAKQLPWYMHPLNYFFMPSFPLNQNKKTNRLAIQKWAQTQYDTL